MNTAVLVGEEGLLTICGDHLLSREFRITSVVTRSSRVRNWAQSHSIPCYADFAALRATAHEQPDYLFSITNFTVIPRWLRDDARLGAVNFHDGPLPELGGLNTPAWAIMEGRSDYAVTWHLVTENVDAGPVICKREFSIPDRATVFDLNTLCFEHAVESFPSVVDSLLGRPPASGPETPPDRYCRRDDKLPRLGFIDWNWTTDAIERMYRASENQQFRNPLGVLKCSYRQQLFRVEALEVVGRSVHTPGQIVEGGKEPVIACADGAVRLTLAPWREGTIEEFDGGSFDDDGLDLGDLIQTMPTRLDEHRWLGLVQSAIPAVIANLSSSQTTRVRQFEYMFPENVSTDAQLAGVVSLLSALNGTNRVAVVMNTPATRRAHEASLGYFEEAVPFVGRIDDAGLQEKLAGIVDGSIAEVAMPTDLSRRYPEAADSLESLMLAALRISVLDGTDASEHDIVLHRDRRALTIRAVLSDDAWSSFEELANHVLGLAATCADWGSIDPVPPQQRRLLEDLSINARVDTILQPFPFVFDEVASLHPQAVAVVDAEGRWTYSDLRDAASRVCTYLSSLDLPHGALIGVMLPRSKDTLAVMLAVMRSGFAYVPLDPEYPAERIEYVIRHSGVACLITRDVLGANTFDVRTVTAAEVFATDAVSPNRADLSLDDPAYVIYTSGSTGKPKGVQVSHGNLANFLLGMSRRLGSSAVNMLSVTSISFDISVLEFWWTLSNGGKVVIYESQATREVPPRIDVPLFSLYFWNATGEEARGSGYGLLLDVAKWGDERGFTAVWTPERHFGSFGGAYPNPSVTSAAIAAITSRIGIRAGSCVLPLHHPIRVAEEWAVVDAMSGGRVGISFASGWMPNDFVLSPDSYANAKEGMYDQIDTVRRLWRGEQIEFPGPNGAVAVRTLPRPIQPELPVWVTTAGSPDSFRRAGECGYSVLTHLLGQTFDALAQKIATYRAAWKAAGHSGDGHVTLMLHTLVSDSDERARELAREPMKAFLKTSLSLIKDAAWDFPTFKKFSDDEKRDTESFFESLSAEDLDALLDFAFERYFETSGLFGSIDRARKAVARCQDAGVSEIACLIDFGLEASDVLENLSYLGTLKSGSETSVDRKSVGILIEEEEISHLQCTPSQFGMMLLDAENHPLDKLDHLLLGGEALNQELANQACGLIKRVTNMYGPTETTVWSLTKELAGNQPVTLGTPIANTCIRVVDGLGRDCAVGVVGELLIGGQGVAQGYLHNEPLTRERFEDRNGVRYYRTGDEVRLLRTGEVEYIGRNDNQVKIRGYRIELGEIENNLAAYPGVRQAVALAGNDRWGNQELLAVVVTRPDRLQEGALRDHLAARLPDYMIPTRFFFETTLPYTPNGKVDRKALLDAVSHKRLRSSTPSQASAPSRRLELPASDVETQIRLIWTDLLQRDDFGRDDNFFDLGGHSILAIRMQGELNRVLNTKVPISVLFQHPSLASLASKLGAEPGKQSSLHSAATKRAQRRKQLRRTR